MPLRGHPDALLDAADQLSRVARRLSDVQRTLASHAREVTTTATWSGTAAPLAAARVGEHPAAVARAADAAARAVAPLRAFAEELRAAQRDHALGEQMTGDGEAAYAAVGSGAVAGADATREAATQTITDGANVMSDAEDRLRTAVIQAFKDEAPSKDLHRAADQAEDLARSTEDEAELRQTMIDLGIEYMPWADGWSSHAWLRHLAERFRG